MNGKDAIMDKIQSCLRKTSPDLPFAGENDDLVDLGLDSLRLAMLVVELERGFATKIPLDKILIENFRTLAHIRALIEETGGKK